MDWEHEGPCDCAPGEGHRIDRNYCEHGTFIGDPYGPDYMCHWCEMDDGDHQYELEQLRRRRIEALAPQLDKVLRQMHAIPEGSFDPQGPVFTRFMRLYRWGVRSSLLWNLDRLNEEA